MLCHRPPDEERIHVLHAYAAVVNGEGQIAAAGQLRPCAVLGVQLPAQVAVAADYLHAPIEGVEDVDRQLYVAAAASPA